MDVAVIGCGYVGLVTAAGLADLGHSVIGIDKDPRKINKLKAGIIPIYEPGLAELVQRNLVTGRLTFTESIRPAVERSVVLFITVGTPSNYDGTADLTQVGSGRPGDCRRNDKLQSDHQQINGTRGHRPAGQRIDQETFARTGSL